MKREWINCPDPNWSPHPLSALDLNYAHSGNVIGTVYVFDDPLRELQIRTGLVELARLVPALTGRIDPKSSCVVLNDHGLLFEIAEYCGSSKEFQDPIQNIHQRLDFVHEPKRIEILKGRAPLMTVRLTHFRDGGSMLGMAISHCLVDGYGFHRLMQYLSEIILGHLREPVSLSPELYDLGTSRTVKAWKAEMRAQNMALPGRQFGLIGRAKKEFMGFMLDRFRARGREMFHFTPGQLEQLKANILEESGLDWISTNMALGAHLISAILPLQRSAKDRDLGIGNVVNVRSRIAEKSGSNRSAFIGNALCIMIDNLSTEGPLTEIPRGAIARHLRSSFDKMTSEHLEWALNTVFDALSAGYGYPGLGLTDPIMSINNQAKFDVYNVDYGVGRPRRVIPHDVGDHIMIFPAMDGGVEVYIRDFVSVKRQAMLQQPKWRDRIYAI